MPLYLCQAGLGHAEPWRQGISVYPTPHPYRTDNRSSGGSSSTAVGSEDHGSAVVIRRVRHAEVVLVDDISISHGRYWLRLRWPGHKGGFAGYIAVQEVLEIDPAPRPKSLSSSTTMAAASSTAAAAATFTTGTTAGDPPGRRVLRNATFSRGTLEENQEAEEQVDKDDSLEENNLDGDEAAAAETARELNNWNEDGNMEPLLPLLRSRRRIGTNDMDRIDGASGVDNDDDDDDTNNGVDGGGEDGQHELREINDDEEEDDDEEEEEDDDEDDDEGEGVEGMETGVEDETSLLEDDSKPGSSTLTSPLVACLRTGLAFLSSDDMHLLPLYDDGLSPSVAALTTTTVSSFRSRGVKAVTAAAASLVGNNSLFTTEPVFCRICREGLHDDADDEQPTATEDNEAEDGGGGSSNRNNNNRTAAAAAASISQRQAAYRLNTRQSSSNMEEDDYDEEEEEGDETTTEENVLARYNQNFASGIKGSLFCRPVPPSTGPVLPHPVYAPNQPALDNPLLAPCECSGSMAFVHYLCVEQWRCRSRHPAAQNGLNCETCGGRYALPPPTSRPANVQAAEQQQQAEDWLDAMPPHVMQALRNPHFMWQVGTAVVRRRWLRPLAPVLMSPIVALYCRARRLLKKRGVARRRWACSLCRRRARWKCVRCLRSYYCSRHCQNVAWHIIHKHVCYKPVRLWWSTVVYGALCLVTFPGILRDPLMYDLGLFLLPFSFIVIGILAGGFATSLKKAFGLDLRGRLLELTVVLGTLWLSVVSWGLVQAFFGQTEACQGSLGRRVPVTVPLLSTTSSSWSAYPANNSNFSPLENDAYLDRLVVGGSVASTSLTLYWIQRLLLIPAQSYYLMWDRLFLNAGSWLQSILCLPATTAPTNGVNETSSTTMLMPTQGCFEFLPHADANFFIFRTDASDRDSSSSSSSVAPSKCAADLLLVWYLYFAAAVAYVASALYKQRERRQRRLQQQQQQHQQQQRNHHHHHFRHHHMRHHRAVLQPPQPPPPPPRPHQD